MEERGMEEVKPAAVEDKAAAEKAVEERVAQEKTEDSTAQNKGTEEREMEGEVNVEREMVGEVEVVTPCPTESHGLQGTIKGHDLFGYVGIEAVLDQMRRKTMKAGFEFNIMVVGQSGLGKSTLVNTLFKSKVSRKSCSPNYEEKISKTVKLQSVSHGAGH
ncbi:neuronal-specific septin-3-like [Salvelinus namaycush]|uniref:Neuronal-specific septin-3-like n=1 Tax=Salvelinus namaycush TaxID=8040 RepID=A0A8U0U6N4_SALNM|nr:neuronal-specific septin-3-like [Salvelinus namaycush]